jgi:hypothetical protein
MALLFRVLYIRNASVLLEHGNGPLTGLPECRLPQLKRYGNGHACLSGRRLNNSLAIRKGNKQGVAIDAAQTLRVGCPDNATVQEVH